MLLVKISIFFVIAIETCRSTKVCSTCLGYFTNTGCHDTDLELNVTEVMRKWDVIVEEYNVTTKDGYQIFVIRAYKNISQCTAVILGHGIAANCHMFVSHGKNSLAYLLIQTGVDVYLINFRGTKYSLVANNLTQNDRAYWDFSFHHMGIYDLPAVIDFVYQKTGCKIIYIGYSMGTTVSYVYASINSTHADQNLKGIISMAPVATFIHAKSLVRWLAPAWPLVKPFVDWLGNGKALSRGGPKGFLGNSMIVLLFRKVAQFPIFGFDFSQIDCRSRNQKLGTVQLYEKAELSLSFQEILSVHHVKELCHFLTNRQRAGKKYYLPRDFRSNPDVIGTDVITHYVDIIKSKKFQQFNYGSKENLLKYGSKSPPQYNFARIRVNITLYVGENDWLASSKDADNIYRDLPEQYRYGLHTINYTRWNHVDFVAAKDMVQYINSEVVKKVKD